MKDANHNEKGKQLKTKTSNSPNSKPSRGETVRKIGFKEWHRTVVLLVLLVISAVYLWWSVNISDANSVKILSP